MAMTFSSEGCKQAANDLNQTAKNLDVLLHEEFEAVMQKVKAAYESETADELYRAYDKVKEKFPEFIDSVTNCSKYLSDTVAPAYEKVEATAASKIEK